MRARGVAPLTLALALGACASNPAPDPASIEHTAVLARVAATENELEKSERERVALASRVEALERAAAQRPADPEKASLRATVAALESRAAALEEKVLLLEVKATPAQAPVERASPEGVTILDRSAGDADAPPAHALVLPLAAIDGETFSFKHGHAYDRALLLGIEVPLKPETYAGVPERRARAVAAWGEAQVASDAAWQRVRDRLSELLVDGELSIEYDADHPEHRENGGRGRLLVYARVTKPDGSSVVVNDVLVREGLALPHGSHARAADLEKLVEEARREKRGLFAGR